MGICLDIKQYQQIECWSSNAKKVIQKQIKLSLIFYNLQNKSIHDHVTIINLRFAYYGLGVHRK